MSVLFTGAVETVPFPQFSLLRAKAFFFSHACKVAGGKLSFLLDKSRKEKNVIFLPRKARKGEGG